MLYIFLILTYVLSYRYGKNQVVSWFRILIFLHELRQSPRNVHIFLKGLCEINANIV